jgi:putative endonuclease
MNSTESKGHLGEIIAVLLLKIKGYKILARRFKTSCGEIDIIAQKNNVIAYIEVKSRKTIDKCYDAITQKQLSRIQRSSKIFMDQNKKWHKYFSRYDVILVANWKLPIHLENISM